MFRVHGIAARLGSTLKRWGTAIGTRWHWARTLALGLRTAWAACASVLIAMLIIVYSPQGQDLFLDVRGSHRIGTEFWIGFYAGVVLIWLVPVYISARWILTQCPPAAHTADDLALASWVERAVPRLLVTTGLAVLLLGQMIAVATAPYILDAANTLRNPKIEILFILAFLFVLVALATFRRYLFSQFQSLWDERAWRKNCLGLIVTLVAASAVLTFGFQLNGFAGSFLGLAQNILGSYLQPRLVIVGLVTLQLVPVVLIVGALLSYVPIRWIKACGVILIAVSCVGVVIPVIIGLATLIIADLSGRLTALAAFEYAAPLGIGHLAILPPVTLLLAYIAWWSLGPPREAAEVTSDTSDPRPVLDALRFFGTLNGAFAVVLLLSISLIFAQLLFDPIAITDHIYRALLLPFVLGLFVPVITFVSYGSFRWHVPIVLAAIVTIAFIFPDTDDVRRVPKTADRPTLAESVSRWQAANDCEPGSNGSARPCPSPIIIAAAGGASRSAFLLGSVVGKLLDESKNSSGEELRPFDRQTFAISGVSGGALGAVVTYAALADRITTQTAPNALGAPPCVEGVHDTEWFAPSVKKGPKPSESWRDCLQLILAGDFLSPVIVGLADDLMGLSPKGRDRGTVLESAWEQRYAHITGQTLSRTPKYSTLGDLLIAVRQHATERNIWLPMLVLSGTSVTTGRRILTSDVDTLLAAKLNNLRGRLFRDAYDLHELISTSHGINRALFSPDGRHILVAFTEGDKARILQAGSGNTLLTLDVGSMQEAVWSADGRYLLTMAWDAGAKLWKMPMGEEVTTFAGRDVEIRAPSFSADGRRLVAVKGDNVVLWDVELGQELPLNLPDTDGNPALSHDGRLILIPNDNEAVIYDAESGKSLSTIPKFGYGGEVVFSRDDKRILLLGATEGGKRAVVFDRETGQKLFDTEYTNRIAAIGPDGDRVLYAPLHGSMRIRELATRAEVEIAESSGDDWAEAAFSDDGMRIMTWTARGGARLLDAKSGRELRVVRGQEELVSSAIMTRDGTRAFTWSANGLGRLWNLDTGEELYIVRSPASVSGCNNCDIRLSTAATMSARFPIISPHGNLRSGNTLVDRVVDGGYFENFGALTALELADELRSQFGLDPRIILVNNEPAVAGMSCLTRDSQLDFPHPERKITFSTLRSPIDAMWATRTARGTHAAVDLCARIGGGDKFAFITVRRDKRDSDTELSMSWWLSKHVQQYLDAQVGSETTGSNLEAFRIIEQWRRYPPGAHAAN